MHLENGNTVVIEAPDNSDNNRYIGAMKLNGKNYKHNFLKHETLMNGARIKYRMVAQPAKNRGIDGEDAPYSFSKEK